MNCTRYIAIIFILCFLTTPRIVLTQTISIDSLTLDRAITLALENHPSLSAADANFRSASERVHRRRFRRIFPISVQRHRALVPMDGLYSTRHSPHENNRTIIIRREFKPAKRFSILEEQSTAFLPTIVLRMPQKPISNQHVEP